MIDQIRDFILGGGDFNQIAMKLWKHQVESSASYGRFCNHAHPKSWREIPAVPVALFRDVTFTTFPPFLGRVVFRTSGTTGKRGTHILQDTEIYDLGALKHMKQTIGGVPNIGLSLVSPAVDSSLGHMCRYFAPHMLQGFDLDVGIRHNACWSYLESAKEPIFVPGTAFAFDALLHNRKTPCPLPEGSVIMVTGGYKGRRTQLQSEDLADALKRVFGEAQIVGEYGMTELSSQLWSPNLDDRFIPPPWMRVLAVNPHTGHPTDGRGQLRFIDLANHQSVLAIETRDEGIVHSDGSLTLFGRMANAPARGCSLTVESVDKHFQADDTRAPSHSFLFSSSIPQPHKRPNAIDQTLKAIQELSLVKDIASLSQGLSKENATWGFHHAIQSITKDGLQTTLHNGIRPNKIAVVVAHGVFVSGIEWIAMAAASGAEVLIKAPAQGGLLYEHLAEALSHAGLPVSCTTEHNLGTPDWIIAFGGDETITQLQKSYPNTPIQGYGHRFSINVVHSETQDTSLSDLARSIHAYDTRGCMAPVATFVLNYNKEWQIELYKALQEDSQIYPPGRVDQHHEPEIRRRHGLARIYGECHSSSNTSLLYLPNMYFYPSALPRTAVIHPIENISELETILKPWSSHLSSIGWGLSGPAPDFGCRTVPIAALQRPTFPRLHDGQKMWVQL